MRILRFLYARRLTLSLSLLGVLAFSSGCGGEGEAPSPKAVEQQQKSEADARKQAYGGTSGVPVGKKASEAASKP
jgi:hypothetical protein